MTLSIIDTQHNNALQYTECHYAECRFAECRYAKLRYAECRGAIWLTFCRTSKDYTKIKMFAVTKHASLK